MKYRIKWKNKYWNSCGWTKYKKIARTYTYAEAFEMADEMFDSDIPAKIEPMGGKND